MEYRRVELDDGSVRFVLIPDDPVASLRGLADGEDWEDVSIEELQAAAVLEARRQADVAKYQQERWSVEDDV